MSVKTELFKKLNDFFDHIYLITLRKSTERQERIRNVLDGLDYDFFWAVNGYELDMGELERQGNYNSDKAKWIKFEKKVNPKDLSPGMIGCSLSHVNVYKDMLEKNYKCVLILEDDLIVESGKTDVLEKAISELPEDWELFYLGYLFNNNSLNIPAHLRIHLAYPLLSALGFKRYNPHRFRCKYPRPYSGHLDLSGYHYGTHAYGVTATGAKKILDFQSPVVREPDNALAEMCMNEMIRAFNIKERIFHQNRKLPSTITDHALPSPSPEVMES